MVLNVFEGEPNKNWRLKSCKGLELMYKTAKRTETDVPKISLPWAAILASLLLGQMTGSLHSRDGNRVQCHRVAVAERCSRFAESWPRIPAGGARVSFSAADPGWVWKYQILSSKISCPKYMVPLRKRALRERQHITCNNPTLPHACMQNIVYIPYMPIINIIVIWSYRIGW